MIGEQTLERKRRARLENGGTREKRRVALDDDIRHLQQMPDGHDRTAQEEKILINIERLIDTIVASFCRRQDVTTTLHSAGYDPETMHPDMMNVARSSAAEAFSTWQAEKGVHFANWIGITIPHRLHDQFVHPYEKQKRKGLVESADEMAKKNPDSVHSPVEIADERSMDALESFEQDELLRTTLTRAIEQGDLTLRSVAVLVLLYGLPKSLIDNALDAVRARQPKKRKIGERQKVADKDADVSRLMETLRASPEWEKNADLDQKSVGALLGVSRGQVQREEKYALDYLRNALKQE